MILQSSFKRVLYDFNKTSFGCGKFLCDAILNIFEYFVMLLVVRRYTTKNEL